MALAQTKWISEAEYWALNDVSEHVKYEWFNGEIYAMAGGSPIHHVLVAAAARILGNQRKGGCRVVSESQRVQVKATGLHTYPDVVVYCPPFRFHAQRDDTLLNPKVIVEVLSKSTQDYDRGEKFAHYRSLESLTDYVLVSQERIEVEVFSRSEDESWILRAYRGVESVARLSGLKATLPLGELYEDTEISGATPPLR